MAYRRGRGALGLAFVALSGLMHEVVAQTCEPAIKLSDDKKDMGGSCPVDNPYVGSIMQTLLQRGGPTEALIGQLARAEPVSAELGGIRSLNSVPTNNATINGLATELALSLRILRISEISQKSQTFKMHYIMDWAWRDCRLLSGCMATTVTDKHEDFPKFWTPSVRIEEKEEEDLHMLEQEHVLWGHGWHIFTEDHVGTFRCSFDFSDMPFDIQKCRLSFMLPHMPEKFVKLKWANIVGEELLNSEWNIDQADTWQKSQGTVAVPGSFGDILSTRLTAEFTFERRPDFLRKNFVLQACIFYTLSWVGLWIDVAAVPARAAVGIIPVLVTSNKMSSLATIIPPISYMTRLESFMDMTLAMISIHMIEFGMVHWAARCYKKFSQNAQPPVQAWDGEGDKQLPHVEKRLSEKVFVAGVTFIHLHLETHMRWLSPLVFAVGTAAILG